MKLTIFSRGTYTAAVVGVYWRDTREQVKKIRYPMDEKYMRVLKLNTEAGVIEVVTDAIGLEKIHASIGAHLEDQARLQGRER